MNSTRDGNRVADDVLVSCENEPIHIPGCVQPHGILFALNPRDLSIEQVSDNVESLFGQGSSSLLGEEVAVALGQEAARQLRGMLAISNLSRPQRFAFEAGGGRKVGVVHVLDDVLIVEVEPADDEDGGLVPLDATDQVHTLIGLMTLGADGLSVRDFSLRLVEYVRSLTGYDRVMVYQFDEENNGEVIAEARIESILPYVGLHFPFTDIPKRDTRAIHPKPDSDAGRRRLPSFPGPPGRESADGTTSGYVAIDPPRRLAGPRRVSPEHGRAGDVDHLDRRIGPALGAHRLPPLPA